MNSRAPLWVLFLLMSARPLRAADAHSQDVAVRPTVSVKDFGAKGDGVADDTGAVRAAAEKVAAGGSLVFPQGTYRITNIRLVNLRGVDISGHDAVIRWFGAAAQGSIGFEFVGTCVDVTIHDLTIIGDGVVEHKHVGIWGFSGQTLKDIKIRNCRIQNVVIGISLNADLGGSIFGAEISNNSIEDVVGTLPGTGYGIHLSDGSGRPSQIRVVANTIIRAHRHAIYQARGSGVVITRNVIREHRRGDEKGPNRSAVAIARSSNCVFSSNVIRDAVGEAIGVDQDDVDTSTSRTHDISIVNNTVEGTKGLDLRIGSENAHIGNVPERVRIQNNVFLRSGAPTSPSVILNSGSQIEFVRNDWRIGAVHNAYPIASLQSHQNAVLTGVLFRQNKVSALGKNPNSATFVEAQGHSCDAETDIRFDDNDVGRGGSPNNNKPILKSCSRDMGAAH